MKTAMFSILLSFGSNLGNRQKTLKDAWHILGQTDCMRTVRLSPFYETEPVGGPEGQPLYINAAGIVQTTMTPMQLLNVLQKIEAGFGRVRNERWGARTLDIDILLYEDHIIDLPALTIPHKEMLHRQFVLVPAIDIAGDWIHPITAQRLCEIKVNKVNKAAGSRVLCHHKNDSNAAATSSGASSNTR